ncbi:hypothetical protein [Ochrobactrum sp. A-1]|uniref:hypothetical protein n=1 Tax=Ochrobactrum sp. A-1 TaxID=2920940 RepID=UPI001F0A8FA6|nr:hypothetical protein [Ochrobactrum sp. A-1]
MADEITNFVGDGDPDMMPQDTPAETAETPESEAERNLVKRIQATIKADKDHFKDDFAQMRRDMYAAKYGRVPDYPKEHYKANLAGRHVKQKTAALYAKNPKAVARRRDSLDFAIWDENPQSLQMAMQTISMAQQMQGAIQPQLDPATGQMISPPIPPEIEQAFTAATELVEDFQQGMTRRTTIQKIGKTLEILFAQALREQKPVDFKTGMKKMVRRACTTGVGYVELGFQREYGQRPAMAEKMADFRDRLDHLRNLATQVADGTITEDDPEIAELQHAIETLQNEPEVLLREGLIVDFPQSTRVIPDKLTRELVGFVGARHLTIEYLFTEDQVREMFDVDIGNSYIGYAQDGKANTSESSANIVPDDDTYGDMTEAKAVGKGTGLICVWKHYDKPSGQVYYVADGYQKFLRKPAAPDVFVEDFWPVYALTFNEVESDDSPFPPSDVFLMIDQQMEYNRSRQGMREHRQAARPRWAYQNGLLQDEDVARISTAKPFDAIAIDLPDGQGLKDVLQPVPVPGVDPNLYETGQIFSDIELTVGSSEAQFGGLSKATATESAIAANASASSDSSGVDDLDAFLTMVARAAGQILLREMSEEQVKAVVGIGAVWPQMTLADIANELFLEVEAGSSGKPNQAVEIRNWKEMLPFLLQMPNISPMWLARETVRRLDDKADLTEALAEGTMSVMAANKMAQIGTGDPATDPNSQGEQGADNAPTQTEQSAGSEPAFGSNQV